jgi:hypothetical protein
METKLTYQEKKYCFFQTILFTLIIIGIVVLFISIIC